MATFARFTLSDGLAAAAPLAKGRGVPAVGAACVVREGGLPEAARFDGLREGAAPPCALPCEFVAAATPADAERTRGNDEALARVRVAFRKWFADEGREALVARFRFSLRRERLTMTIAVAGFVDLRPLADALEKKFQTTVAVRALSPRSIAGATGGLGPCGRPLCCSLGLAPESEPRGAPRDPASAGVCGRARCCLFFEGSSPPNPGAPR